MTEKLTADEARQAGYNRGRNIASGVSLDTAIGYAVEEGTSPASLHIDIYEQMRDIAHNAETSDRDFTPFEFVAAYINSQEDDTLWDAFDDGISRGIADEIDCRLGNIPDAVLCAKAGFETEE